MNLFVKYIFSLAGASRSKVRGTWGDLYSPPPPSPSVPFTPGSCTFRPLCAISTTKHYEMLQKFSQFLPLPGTLLIPLPATMWIPFPSLSYLDSRTSLVPYSLGLPLHFSFYSKPFRQLFLSSEAHAPFLLTHDKTRRSFLLITRVMYQFQRNKEDADDGKRKKEGLWTDWSRSWWGVYDLG